MFLIPIQVTPPYFAAILPGISLEKLSTWSATCETMNAITAKVTVHSHSHVPSHWDNTNLISI